MTSMRPKPWETGGATVQPAPEIGNDVGAESMPVVPPKPEELGQQNANQPNGVYDNTMGGQGYTSTYASPYSSYGGMGSYGGMSRYGMGGAGYGSTYGMGGMYGGGAYGSGYGMGGMYGGGGYGMGGGIPGMGGLSDSTNQALSLLESLLLTFSSLTTLLESTYYATNNAVMSIGGVMGQIGAVSGVIGGIGAVFKDMGGELGSLVKSVLRLVAKLVIKVLRLVGVEGLSGDSVHNLNRVGWLRANVIKMLRYLGLDEEVRTGNGDQANMVGEFIKWKRGTRGAEEVKRRRGKLWPLVVLIAAVFSVPLLMKRIAEYHEKQRGDQRQLQTVPQGGIVEMSQQTKVDPRELTFAKAKYAFKPEDANSNELELSQNDLVAVLSEDSHEWWHCRARDGRTGYVPRSWLQVVKQGTPRGGRGEGAVEGAPKTSVAPTPAPAPLLEPSIK